VSTTLSIGAAATSLGNGTSNSPPVPYTVTCATELYGNLGEQDPLDLRWKIALAVAVDHQGWHPTSRTRFRARLLLYRLERVALERDAGARRGAGDA